MGGKRNNRAAAAPTAPALTRAVLPCEIRVVDEKRREIEVCATSERLDSYGTVFGYDASKDAFSRWAGNVREMHERKAVGRRVAVRFDDAARKVYTRVRISEGAEDTWLKVKDGTLNGASIGASNVEWRTERVGGEDVPLAVRYDLVELSLVDLASNPDAQGVTFVRDGVPDSSVLAEVEGVTDGAATGGDPRIAGGAAHGAAVSAPVAPVSSPVIREQAGALSTDDPAAAIAAAALSRGVASLTNPANSASDASPVLTGRAARSAKLAALGAPGYVQRASGSSDDHDGEDPGAGYDFDGDHDGAPGAGPPASEMAHGPEMHAHEAHEHAHTGDYDDYHRHTGAHQHADGTSHIHAHLHDHGHHDHARADRVDAQRAMAGHSHTHSHTHGHEHYYRVADGAPVDARLVSAEQARALEFVTAKGFRAAGGIEGRGLTPQQTRVLGPYSRDEHGPADAGTPATAAADPTMADANGEGNAGMGALSGVDLTKALCAMQELLCALGLVRPLDRDGQPTEEGDEPRVSTGTLDVSVPPDGWNGRSIEASVTRAVEASYRRIAGMIGDLSERVKRIEAQPMPGGPQLRTADRTTPLHPGQPGADAQYQALEALAGRLSDPQAQVAVAAEMIRLQQQQAGMSPAMQVMPRAGRGWGG